MSNWARRRASTPRSVPSRGIGSPVPGAGPRDTDPATETDLRGELLCDIFVNVDVPGSGEKDLGHHVLRVESIMSGSSNMIRVFVPASESTDADGREPEYGATRWALVSDELPESEDSWTFHLRTPDGTLHRLGDLPVPSLGDSGLPTVHRATLDDRGRLRVHAGEIPYKAAQSLQEVQDHPGWVLRTRMEEHIPDRNTARDPFNGKH